jgi:hypothetical protein
MAGRFFLFYPEIFCTLIISKDDLKSYHMKALIDHFEQAIQVRGGTLIDEARRQRKGFLCAILPFESYLQAGDLLTAGAALKIREDSVSLYTYLLRQVCTNGMVQPMLQQEHRFEEGQLSDFQIELQLGLDALYQHGLSEQVDYFKGSLQKNLDDRELRRAISTASIILKRTHLREDLTHRIREERGRTVNRGRVGEEPRRFDLINGLTALARDTADPMQRWQLMEFAGRLLRKEKHSLVGPQSSSSAAKRRTSLKIKRTEARNQSAEERGETLPLASQFSTTESRDH